jgi:hypothetical protein
MMIPAETWKRTGRRRTTTTSPADILERVEQRLHPGSLVIANDTHRCPDYVQSIRAEAHKYLSVPLVGDVALSMRLS